MTVAISTERTAWASASVMGALLGLAGVGTASVSKGGVPAYSFTPKASLALGASLLASSSQAQVSPCEVSEVCAACGAALRSRRASAVASSV
jgi:hypothetical protein